MSWALTRNLLMPPRPEPRLPRIAIVFPLEGKVDVEVKSRRSKRERLFDDLPAADRRAPLIERAFELAENDEAA